MAIIKCKMCGGDLRLIEDSTVCECEYCGTRQTVPKADDEKKLKLFERANRLRAACEFDKAAGVYESILADFDREAEAYWGLVLCKYGIEYVDDPATGKKIPTCHRSSFDSVLDDPNFEQACENTDALARRVYRDEARAIEALRQAILQVSGREEPYDVFISYKERDGAGQRTLDSVLAQDIYTELTGRGYRVFFSRISLEDKLGTEYEPYIFAALNSARVMLVVGTDYENLDSVWVKNEWSRFLKLMAKGEKKTLIPVFKGMDAYDMPKEFNKLAALDMGKVGAMQDLIRGVEKILGKKKEEAPPQPQQVIVQQTVVQGGANLEALLKRGFMSLEDRQWENAKELFNKVLNDEPENAKAYLGIAMAEAQTHSQTAYAALYLRNAVPGYEARRSPYAARAKKYDPELARWYAGLDEQIRKAEKRERLAQEIAKKAERLKKQEAAARLPAIRQRNASADGMLSAGCSFTVGLRTDGIVVATKYLGDYNHGQSEVSGLRDMVAVSAGTYHTVGLKADGTVVATKYTGNQREYDGQCDVSGWRDIVAVSAGGYYTMGLKADGTVVATEYTGKKDLHFGPCDVSRWRDVVAVSAGGYHLLGLCKDGTVLATGSIEDLRCYVSHWRDVVAVSAGHDHTVGLLADGTVLARGCNVCGQCDVSGWRNVVAVSAGHFHTVGLLADGTVVATKNKGVIDTGEWNVSGWKLFNSVQTIEAERKAAWEKEEAKRKAKLKALNEEKAWLQTELANLKGLFTGKRRKEIEARLAQIEKELALIPLPAPTYMTRPFPERIVPAVLPPQENKSMPVPARNGAVVISSPTAPAAPVPAAPVPAAPPVELVGEGVCIFAKGPTLTCDNSGAANYRKPCEDTATCPRFFEKKRRA